MLLLWQAGPHLKDCRSRLRDIKKGKQPDHKKDKDQDKDKDEEKHLNVVTSSNTPTLSEDLSTSDILVFTSELEADALVAQEVSMNQNWIIDSGASFHVTPHKDWFSTYAKMHGPIKVGDTYELEIGGIGDIKLVLHNGTGFML